MPTSVLDRVLLGIRGVPSSIVVVTALASYATEVLAIIQDWPLWAIAVATAAPWVPLFGRQISWAYRHYHYLALFYVLVVVQSGHVAEHVAQMVQLHVLGLRGPDARGIISVLDVEWVHVTFNTFVFVAVVLLLLRFRSNPWLWVTLAIAGWHEVEHLSIMSVYLTTGKVGTPGLLSAGGALGGGLPLIRPDLHFLYNMVETTPLYIAFVYQLRHVYQEWLRQAFPETPEEVVAEASSHTQSLSFEPGARIVQQGAAPDRMYVIVSGEVSVRRQNAPGSSEEHLRSLGPGGIFGEIGLLSDIPRTASVYSESAVEVLALDRLAFKALVGNSATAQQLKELAEQRLGAAPVP